jgi:hypothetical protein
VDVDTASKPVLVTEREIYIDLKTLDFKQF